MSFATLAGLRVTSARVHLPPSGVWTADVDIGEAAALSGRVALVVGGLTLSGTVRPPGGDYQGASRFRLEGGAGGWRKRVVAKAYRLDAGVKLSTVVVDAARAAGETLAPDYTDRRIGRAFVREAGPASRVLAQLQGLLWWVDVAGLTHLGARPAGGDVGVRFDVLAFDPARRTATLATEAPEGIAVGAVLRSGVPAPLRVLQADLELQRSSLRVHVWGAAA